MLEPWRQPDQAASVAPSALLIAKAYYMTRLISEIVVRRFDHSRAPTAHDVTFIHERARTTSMFQRPDKIRS